MGETTLGELALELVRDLCFADLGTSWSLKPSCWLGVFESVEVVGPFDLVELRSWVLGTTGEAVVEPFAGVLTPEVSRLPFLPFS